MKIDVEAYELIKDRLRRNTTEIEQKIKKHTKVYNDISSCLEDIKSLINDMNEGVGGWQIRSMDDKFDE